MVVISEKHAQVIGFPSRNCHNRVSYLLILSVYQVLHFGRSYVSDKLGSFKIPISDNTVITYIFFSNNMFESRSVIEVLLNII